MPYISVSEAAKTLGARRRDISDLFYQGELRDDLCPILSGRRCIPHDYLPVIRMALAKHGRQLAPISIEARESAHA